MASAVNLLLTTLYGQHSEDGDCWTKDSSISSAVPQRRAQLHFLEVCVGVLFRLRGSIDFKHSDEREKKFKNLAGASIFIEKFSADVCGLGSSVLEKVFPRTMICNAYSHLRSFYKKKKGEQ
jgi:hypothetical protein